MKEDIVLVVSNNKESSLLTKIDIIKLKHISIIKTSSLEEAMAMLQSNSSVNLAIMHYIFLNGKASTLIRFIEKNHLVIPIIIILKEEERDLITQAFIDGACAVFVEPIPETYLLLTVSNLLKLTRKHAHLKISETIIETMSKSLEFKDEDTKGHAKRVADMAVKVYDAIGLRDVEERYKLYIGALLHDIGKVGIPDDILKSKIRFDKDGPEFKILETHTQMGFEICLGVADDIVLDIVLSHHEKLDNSGYPRRLCANQISTLVRIVSICDIYDSLRYRTSYRSPLSDEEALKIIEEEALDNKLSFDVYKVFSKMLSDEMLSDETL